MIKLFLDINNIWRGQGLTRNQINNNIFCWKWYKLNLPDKYIDLQYLAEVYIEADYIQYLDGAEVDIQADFIQYLDGAEVNIEMILFNI